MESRLKIVVKTTGPEGMDRINLAQDRDQWRDLVNTVIDFWASIEEGSFSVS
jgi:hypothetical protein